MDCPTVKNWEIPRAYGSQVSDDEVVPPADISKHVAFRKLSGWLQIHVVTLYVAWGFLLPVGCTAAFANIREHFVGTHQILGLTVFILALLQPLNAIFRPKHQADGKASNSRRIWEFMHKNLGRLVILMAWANVFLGVRLLQDWHSTSPKLTKALIGTQATIIILLTFVAAWRYKTSEVQAEPIPDDDDTGVVEHFPDHDTYA
eukprot:scaffold797_cov408-Chaetoceros_neogracile.AAC.58